MGGGCRLREGGEPSVYYGVPAVCPGSRSEVLLHRMLAWEDGKAGKYRGMRRVQGLQVLPQLLVGRGKLGPSPPDPMLCTLCSS